VHLFVHEKSLTQTQDRNGIFLICFHKRKYLGIKKNIFYLKMRKCPFENEREMTNHFLHFDLAIATDKLMKGFHMADRTTLRLL
jgi:hypothetical protein